MIPRIVSTLACQASQNFLRFNLGRRQLLALFSF